MPVDEIIFEIAQRPAGLNYRRTALLATFAAVGKSGSKSQGLASKHGMDAKTKRQDSTTSKSGKAKTPS